MIKFADLIKEMHPGIFVHSIYIDPELDGDRKAAFVSPYIINLHSCPEFLLSLEM